MKNIKIVLCVFALLLGTVLVPQTAQAADGKITNLSLDKVTTTEVTVSGTTENCSAVMIQIRSADGSEIIEMASFGVLNNAFEGTISDLNLTDGTQYKFYAADYEGGTFTKQTATAVAPAEPEEPAGPEEPSGTDDAHAEEPAASSGSSSAPYTSYVVHPGQLKRKDSTNVSFSWKAAQQGEFAKKSANIVLPKGCEYFGSFNLLQDNTYVYKELSGELKITNLDVKKDRTYGIIVINEDGSAVLYYNTSDQAGEFLANIEMKGYAVYIIYSDDAKLSLNKGTGGNGVYTVVKGDNLSKIAKMLHKSVNHLANLNKIRNINRIYPGQKLQY